MLNQVLATLLPLILWGAVSGVLNLVLTRKSQIEAWVNANPRLAAWSKFLRGVGFDPWAVIAWFTLLVKKKLPEAQQSDSLVAQLEQKKADLKARTDAGDRVHFGPMLVLLFLGLAVSQQGCASWKPVARTTNDVARVLCGEFFGEKQRLSVEEAAKKFCETRDDLAPWLDAVLAAKREAAPKAAARHP